MQQYLAYLNGFSAKKVFFAAWVVRFVISAYEGAENVGVNASRQGVREGHDGSKK